MAYALSIAAVSAIAGCVIHTDPAPASKTTTTSASTTTRNGRAVDRIASARCERAAACNDIGSGHKWASRSDCNRDVRGDMRDTLSNDDCAHGVDDSRLTTCVDAIRNERCDHPLDAIDRIASCRRGELCRK